jgi:hypothetical protein
MSYQTWLDQGNYGTEQDYLDSLKGPPGEPGKNGTDGFVGKMSGFEDDLGRVIGHAIGGVVERKLDSIKDEIRGDPGRDGIDGLDGLDGEPGKDGRDGVNGKDGRDGVDGLDGKDGVDGKDGRDGIDGPPGKSAYELWLDSGNTGTEEDYHQSIAKNAAYWGGVILGPQRGGNGAAAWGSITGTLSNQTDLQTALNLKANTADLGDVAFSNDYNDLDNLPTLGDLAAQDVVSVDGVTITGDGTPGSPLEAVAMSVNWGSIGGTLSAQTDLQTALDGKVDENAAITGATNTKITYDAKGLVTAGAAATTADINDSSNRRYVTDAQLVVIGNTSGTNTGDQTSIVGITGTKAQFDTSLTDGNFLYVGDVTQYTDEMAQDAVGSMVNTTLTYVDGTPSLGLTSRTINGTAFDGTANITITAAAGTLTGTTLAANVVNSSLTSVGTLANLTVTNPIAGSITGNAGTSTTTSNISTANETSDSTCFPVFVTTSGTQTSIAAKTNSTFGYNSTNNTLSVTNFSGNLSGNVNGVTLTTGGSATDYLNAQGNYVSAGAGDVVGPASATDTAIVRFNGTTGKLIQDSGVTIDGSDNVTTPGSVDANTVLGFGVGLKFSSNYLNLIYGGSSLTANRSLEIDTQDATRVLTIPGDATISGTNTGDQTSVTGNAGTVTFVDAGGDATTFVALGTAATGNLSPATDAGLTYNATTNALTTTTFIGALTGNSSTTTALQNARTIGGVSFDGTANIVPQTIQIVDAAADTTTFLMLAGSSTGSLQPLTDAGLSYNASTNALTTTTFVGALTGNADTATTATNGTVANEATDTTCFPLFVTAATGGLPFKSNTSFTFNSNTGALGATSLGGTLTTASQPNITGVGTLSSGNATAIVDASSTTAAGKVELATDAETQTGTDTARVAPVSSLGFHQGAAKAWVKFDASSGTPVISDSYNVTSITDNGVGDFTINFTTAFANANYSWALSGRPINAGEAYIAYLERTSTPSTGSFRMITSRIASSVVPADHVHNTAVFYGDW